LMWRGTWLRIPLLVQHPVNKLNIYRSLFIMAG
jgi:hypothetical protein